MAPANTSPIDAFHQPCVAVRALPRAVLRLTPDGETLRPATQPSADADRTRQPARHYVDLDNLCATPPAFAPTRDIDSTSVWYVDAPSAYRHAVVHGANGLAS
ncbi:hypothetical protein [Pandoraea pnomenusa]|uniref:hypothetical protein n=1 Tax=Pandoraea pnomenusa TaxID=93220 RepID=UPI00333EEDFC